MKLKELNNHYYGISGEEIKEDSLVIWEGKISSVFDAKSAYTKSLELKPINYSTDESLNLPLLQRSQCDEIFGKVDVDKLAKETYKNQLKFFYLEIGFIDGFNKHKELNSDKKFTEEETRKLCEKYLNENSLSPHFNKEKWFEKNLTQQSEIEVEVIMEHDFEAVGGIMIPKITTIEDKDYINIKRK